MSIDLLLHPKKTFFELEDQDVETFLRERKFGAEHLNLEFKRDYPREKKGGFSYRDVCEYIVGFSNSEGGIVVYGIDDSIKDTKIPFPEYVYGLRDHPSLEDLSEWAKNFIFPAIQSPAIRFFTVSEKSISVIKVPAGMDKPYCFVDPTTKTLSFLRKTAGTLGRLGPQEVRQLYRDMVIEQSTRIVAALGPATYLSERITRHREFVQPKMGDTEAFGHLCIYCHPDRRVDLSMDTLANFLRTNRGSFSETLRYGSEIEPFQDGVSVGYYPRAIRQEGKSAARTTIYSDGFAAFDALVDLYMDGDRKVNPVWVTYELQRHLQLSEALLRDRVEDVNVFLDLVHMGGWSMSFGRDTYIRVKTSAYQGQHRPIERKVRLAEVHRYDGGGRNIVPTVVKDIMDEVSRIFGFPHTLAGCWDEKDHLSYVKGLENQR